MSTVRPVVRQVSVAAPPERAFALFTERIAEWWPLGDGHSVFGAGGTVAFESTGLVERHGDRVSVWAEVTVWEPPDALELDWHPGRTAESATRVRVTFEADDDRTLVTLEHDGWERLADAEAARGSYDEGWAFVLSRFAEAAGDRWFALLHRPGPALPQGASLFAQPEFAEHLAFLGRLRERGLLVAAGPVLGGEDGSGMTVVRVRPEHGDVDVAALATEDDKAVALGFLQVDVRPWRVVLSA
ncbi:SRPBCC domain-containing protein [Geodermatophilus sp. URMC 64]